MPEMDVPLAEHVNPKIVWCSLSGFGMTGPRMAEPGYDYILQGLLGWMSVTGEPEGPPTKSGLSLLDYSAGSIAMISLLAALHAARRDGIGMDCDVSLFDTALAMLNYPATWHLNAGFEPVRTRQSAHPSLVPFQLFRTSDGWVVVGCAKDKFWVRLTGVLGRPELARDPRFATVADRNRNRDELLALLNPVFEREPAAHWLDRLYSAGIPCGPVNFIAQALADPQTAARAMIVQTEHPRYGALKMPAPAVRAGEIPIPEGRAPQRNEDFVHVVTKTIGYTDERIRELVTLERFGTRTRFRTFRRYTGAGTHDDARDSNCCCAKRRPDASSRYRLGIGAHVP